MGVLLGVLSKPQSAPALATHAAPSSESLRLEAVALRAQMGEAADLFAESKITGAQLAKINARLQERLDDAEAAMARAARGSALAPFAGRDPVKVWGALTIDRKRDVIREMMTVTVLPSGRRGKVYDPELVRIEPRGGRSERDVRLLRRRGAPGPSSAAGCVRPRHRRRVGSAAGRSGGPSGDAG